MNAATTKWRSKGLVWLGPATLLCGALLLGPVRRIVRSNVIEAVVSEHVNAPADRVRALYRDPDNWARLFPSTIRGARVVGKEGDTTIVEVDHVEGKVVNILALVAKAELVAVIVGER
jgi:hypothetical protein